MPVTAVRANPATPIGLARWLVGALCLANVLLHLDPAYQARFLASLAV